MRYKWIAMVVLVMILAIVSHSPFFIASSVAQQPPEAADWEIPNGWFFTQTASGQGGFSVTNDEMIPLWSEWQRLGGLQTVGYPISRRYEHHGFVTQAFQKLILQWRPDVVQVWPINIFDELSQAASDELLFEARQIPYPIAAHEIEPLGGSWEEIVAARQSLLDADPEIRERYFSVSDPATIFGLPTSQVEDMGNHIALRTQRAVFQRWKEEMPWAAAGDVTIANGGSIAKELGWLPLKPLQPEKPPTEIIDTGGRGLREIAPAKIRVGVAVDGKQLVQPRFAATVRHEFTSITPEVALKFRKIHPCPSPALTDPASERYNPNIAEWLLTSDECDGSPESEWDWQLMDEIVSWATENGFTVYGHTLVWHQDNPDWLTNTKLTSLERQWVLEEHIRTIIHHYCAHPIIAYDVVNETLRPDGAFVQRGPWYDIPNYVDLSFRQARQALQECHPNPESVKLFYNEWGIEYGRILYFDEQFITPAGRYNKSDAVYYYLAGLLSGPNPTPIDGLGFQTHLAIGSEQPYHHNTHEMINTMNRFAALGLEIKITEMDVPISTPNPADFYQEQASYFGGAATACRLVPACTGFTTWGLNDQNSWHGGHRAPLLFGGEPCDDRYCAKPAYFAAWKGLQEE